MIVVDSDVWVDWFNGVDVPTTRRLAHGLGNEDVGVTALILTEVLQGLRLDAAFDEAELVLTGLPLVALDVAGHVAAARLFRTLRRRGVTVRGTIDCLIAQACIAVDGELLTSDRDFLRIAEHSALRLCQN
ncbi:MAG: PIN domain nuclease [Candidatus Rokubacteria bacterium]|nr:PIN domain nuclease [Candidatus Rokubacteria bacterium]